MLSDPCNSEEPAIVHSMCYSCTTVDLHSFSGMLLDASTLQFPSVKTSEKTTNTVESPELHDAALRGSTAIFNDGQSCLGNGGLAWRRFCLLFCWAACSVQDRTLLQSSYSFLLLV